MLSTIYSASRILVRVKSSVSEHVSAGLAFMGRGRASAFNARRAFAVVVCAAGRMPRVTSGRCATLGRLALASGDPIRGAVPVSFFFLQPTGLKCGKGPTESA